MDVGVSSVSSLQSLAKLLGGAHGDEDDDDFAMLFCQCHDSW